LIHGIIGKDVDGVEIAKEIALLNQMGATVITERINSIGGSVIHGYSIIAANLTSKAKIITKCEGVCDSIASAVLASGDVRETMEFGSGLIHNVIADGVTLEAIEDENERMNASKVNDSIVNILTRKTGKDEADLRAMMSKETRFSADELISNGFVDEKVLIQGKKPVLMENFTAEQYMNVCNEFSASNSHNINNKLDNMSINKYLNLKEDASAQDQEAAIQKLQNKAAERDVLQARLDKLEAEKKEAFKKEAEKDVQNLIDAGYFQAEKKESLVNLAIDSPESFKTMTESMAKPADYVNVSGQLNSKKAPEKKDLTEKELAEKYENMMKDDPKGLELLETTDKTLFDNMYNAWDKI
jgi:ATP-dependent protease ClpP protease subunit